MSSSDALSVQVPLALTYNCFHFYVKIMSEYFLIVIHYTCLHVYRACNIPLLRWRIVDNFMTVWLAYNPVEVQINHEHSCADSDRCFTLTIAQTM
jgi:hypothetical protein